MSNNQIDLAVLAVRDNIANCKILKTNEKIILRLSSYQLFKIVPGGIATINPKKQWIFGNNKYISGKLINYRIDIPALNLTPLKCRNFIFTAGEQKWYKGRGYSQPKRCPGCREKKYIDDF